MVRHRLGKHRLTDPRWPKQEQTLPGVHFATFKEKWRVLRHHKRHVDAVLRVLAPCYVAECDSWLSLEDAALQRLLQLNVIFRTEFGVHVEAHLVARS